MKFGYTIIDVTDVSAAAQFYGNAFGFSTRFVHEGGDYAELDTGETTLAFAAHSLGDANFPNGYTKLTDLPKTGWGGNHIRDGRSSDYPCQGR